MNKFCTHCGKELGNNADICLNCGYKIEQSKAKKQKKGLPVWAIILIIFGCLLIFPIIVLVCVFSIIGNDDVENYVDDLFKSETILDEGTIGDTLEDDDLLLTLNKYSMYSKIGDKVASEGKKYLVLFFDVENKDDELKSIYTFNFDGYVDGYAVQSELVYDNIDGQKNLDNNLASGMKASGYVAFEVNDNWSNFEVHYKNDFEKEFIFRFKNNDLKKQST